MAQIILVDDDANILASVRMALEGEGFGVRSFTDGETALQAMASPFQEGCFLKNSESHIVATNANCA